LAHLAHCLDQVTNNQQFLGAVELEGLYIRKDALKEFDLPGIEVKWGYIGNITLRIPSYRNYRYP